MTGRRLTGSRIYRYRGALLLPCDGGITIAEECDGFWALGGWHGNVIEAQQQLDREHASFVERTRQKLPTSGL
jgi:hypothetical protein